jgi:hypothetical protein
MAALGRTLLLLLLCSVVQPTESGKKKGRKLKRKLRSGNNLGAWEEAKAPMHTTVCGDHTCRPGEGNLKGYAHWKQPYESPPLTGLTKYAAHGWSPRAGAAARSAFPSDKYTSLVAAAQRVQQRQFVAMTVADFDFRLLAENWFVSAQRAGLPALVHALDSEAVGYLAARSVAVHNGTANLNAWAETKLQRHIQRALAEKHMAAAALAVAGLDVLMCDSTWVPVLGAHPVLKYFNRPKLAGVDLLAPRGSCNAQKERAGCGPVWNSFFLRGSAHAARRERLVRYMQAAVDTGMIDFYLRWWAGHHCIYMGYEKLWRSVPFDLAGPGPTSAAAVAASPNATAVVTLKGRWCGDDACLRLGMLPKDLFPPPGEYPAVRGVALLGRSHRPDKNPVGSHRLRLDRYDEFDFDLLKEAMVADGLWRLS